MTPWHATSIEDACARLDTRDTGLDAAEVTSRAALHGPNLLPEAAGPPLWRMALRQFESPLILILLVAGAVMLALGEHVDAIVIGAVLALNASIGLFQEVQAERAVRGLMALVSPKAHVLRDGAERIVESAELVPGDLVLLESGAKVPADLRLIEVNGLQVDESQLTGESLPVAKGVEAVAAEAGLADRTCLAHTGSVVTVGRGKGIVVETGARTALGAIASRLGEAERVETPMQARMSRFARTVGAVALASCAAAVAIGAWNGRSWEELFLVGVTLAVGVVPEGLPAVVTIVLAIGVRRMASRNAVIRSLAAAETLGSTTVIGSDKTGTLTENRMRAVAVATEVGAIRPDAQGVWPDFPDAGALALACVLGNEARLGAAGQPEVGDPTELALLGFARARGLEVEGVRQAHPALFTVPFESQRLFSAVVAAEGGGRTLWVKGAPERVLAMSALDAAPWAAQAQALAAEGLRVLAFARRALDPEEPADAPHLGALRPLGLIGLMDPPRGEVPRALAACKAAGVRVIMITGDHAATAQAIAGRLGLLRANARPPVTGAVLSGLSADELGEIVRDTDVFARVSPEQKLEIVRALRARGEVVAVTGDGVNDAPALRAADIGVSMGRGGTDVAREASDMVLTDDHFESIVAAVEEGRITFGNLQKVVFFLISTGAAELVTVLVALALDWPLPYLPAQILWINLVTDGIPTLALAFEPGDRDVLERPPTRRDAGLVTGRMFGRTVVTGLIMAAGTLFAFQRALAASGDLAYAQTVALTTMVLFQLFHAGNARSETESALVRPPWTNPGLLAAAVGTMAVHVGLLNLPVGQWLLRVVPITDPWAWAELTAIAFSVVVGVELHKLWGRPRS